MSEPGTVEEWVKQLCLSDDEATEFRLWWASRHGQYRGTISRQELVDFLQKANESLQREANDLYFAAEKASEQTWKDEFWQQYSASIAKQLAYREVAEWAKRRVEENGSLAENRRD